MRLGSLNLSSLSDYGILLNETPTGDAYEKIDLLLQHGDRMMVYRSDDKIILDYADGMTGLMIHSETGPVYYYLDRIVEIRPGVSFSLFSLEKSSHLTLIHSTDSKLEISESTPVSDDTENTDSFKLQKIYTVFYQETAGNFYFHGEKHEAFELVYVDKGMIHNIVNGHDYVVSKQEFMIIDRNQWHIQYSELPVSFLTISFRHTGDLSRFITGKVIRISPELRLLLNKILDAQNDLYLSKEYTEALLQTFLIELIREPEFHTASKKSPATSFVENQLVDRALQLISENISQKITLPDLAQRLHISVPYLYKLFDEHLKMPPGQYIMKIRLEESKLLLREGRKTIGEIAKSCGFTSIQHYSRQFRQHFETTPTEYMRSLR